jgi:hypothetical protein
MLMMLIITASSFQSMFYLVRTKHHLRPDVQSAWLAEDDRYLSKI